MKKIIIALALFGALTPGLTACSSDDNHATQVEQVTLDQLPANTKQFIETAFPNAVIVKATKVNTPNYYGSFYQLILDNNIEIDFDKSGNWTEIETRDHTAIPAAFLQQEVPLIQAYVTEHYKGSFIVELDKNTKGYQVTLNSDLELIFNAQQEFIGLDLDLDEDEQLIDEDQLPTVAKNFLSTHFNDASIVLIKKEQDSKTTYNVYLSDGFKIEFNQEGEWIEIESKQNKEIPTVLLPNALTSYIQLHYSDYKLVGIEKKGQGFEVELQRGRQEIELLFDREGNFIKVDH